VQAYGQRNLDSSLLLLPLVGFLPAQDLRIVNTVKAIEHELMHNGFLIRYQTEKHDDGLTESEGAFLACTFWLADCLVLQGHVTEAKQYFERLLSIQSDLGLFAEEYDSLNKRQLGNFPQALSHIALINTARNLSPVRGPAEDRSNETADFSKPNFPHPRRKAA
ncbi:MAG: glycoside hydrolase family 15 protein, partial [Bdellovibrionia bacterium]